MASDKKPVVLWIEDKLDSLMKEVAKYLKETGKYDLRSASTVMEARKAIEEGGKDIALVLLDIIIPVGIERIQNVQEMMEAGIHLYRAYLKKLGIPVVVLTCRDDDAAQRAFVDEVGVRMLFKPVFPDEVEKAIDEALG